MKSLPTIKKCRVCKGRLFYGLKIKGMDFVVCQDCTLLQRKEDIPYNISFNFEGRAFSLPYYPVFLKTHTIDWVTEDSCMFFSLKAIDTLLQRTGYTIEDAKVIGDILHVFFEKASSYERIKVFEKINKLDNQYTFFLYNITNQNEKTTSINNNN